MECEDEDNATSLSSGDAVPEAPPAPPPPELPAGVETLCKRHKPTKNRQGKLKYWFFHAVRDGCQKCVKKLVQEMGVDKHAKSDTQGYDAMDFADWFDQAEMSKLLQTLRLFSATGPVQLIRFPKDCPEEHV